MHTFTTVLALLFVCFFAHLQKAKRLAVIAQMWEAKDPYILLEGHTEIPTQQCPSSTFHLSQTNSFYFATLNFAAKDLAATATMTHISLALPSASFLEFVFLKAKSELSLLLHSVAYYVNHGSHGFVLTHSHTLPPFAPFLLLQLLGGRILAVEG